MVQRTTAEWHGLTRGLGLHAAAALNMSNMAGVVPVRHDPPANGRHERLQCLLGWAVGTLLALCDGLFIWQFIFSGPLEIASGYRVCETLNHLVHGDPSGSDVLACCAPWHDVCLFPVRYADSIIA